MSDDVRPQQHRLGNDDIHVQFRNRQDLVHEAIDQTKAFAALPVGPDGQVAVPLMSFRTVVEALRMTYKTVGETIHQSFDPNEDPSMTAYTRQDHEGEEPDADPARPATEAETRFHAGQATARAALTEAAKYSEYNENRFRTGDRITVPAESLRIISAALVERNALMVDLLNRPEMMAELGTMKAIPGHPPDHGDYGANWDPWNTGNWGRD